MPKQNEQAIGDKRLLALYRYWLSKRGDRPLPRRADIDPAEIPALLPIMLLIDVIKTGSYRYRLMGTEFALDFGGDCTGQTFEEALPDGAYREYLVGLANEAVTSRQPLYAEGAFMAKGRADRQVRRLVLPLSSDGTAVDMILAGQTIMPATQDASRIGRLGDLPFAEKIRIRLA